jgi:hypothetical protein
VTFQIKIQKANNCAPKHLVQHIKYEYKEMTILQVFQDIIILNCKQQYFASVFRVYTPLPELLKPEDDDSISKLLCNTRIIL